MATSARSAETWITTITLKEPLSIFLSFTRGRYWEWAMDTQRWETAKWIWLRVSETSMDVDFSVEVIPGDATTQVRAETNDYLIAFGVTGSVPESIQVATSELAKWIRKTYKLSDSEVAILFASTLKYDITELVDSRYNVAAKVPKSILSTMK